MPSSRLHSWRAGRRGGDADKLAPVLVILASEAPRGSVFGGSRGGRHRYRGGMIPDFAPLVEDDVQPGMGGEETGSSITNVVPSPRTLCTAIVPRCFSMIP